MSDYYNKIHTGEIMEITFKKGVISSKSITLVYCGMVNNETFSLSIFVQNPYGGIYSPPIFFNKNLESFSIGRYQFSLVEVSDHYVTIRPTQFLQQDVDL